jgi:outer membrane receptor for ferrienterochelin and colicins
MHRTRGPPAFRRSGAPTTAGMVLAAVVAVSLWPSPARGQTEEERLIEQLDLQTLLNTPVDVWTPSKTPQKSYQAPSIVTTVTREQIAAWGFRSMAELLGHLLGFHVVDDQTSPNVAVRGHSGGLYADSSIIKVLINAHPVAFSPTGGIGLGPELIPLSAVERVEVIRGPASALYGADAFLGMINIQTRQGDAVKGATAWLALGHVGKEMASDVDVSLGTRRGMAEALVSFRRTDQDLSGLALPERSPAPNIPAHNRGARTASGLDQRSTSAIATLTLRPRPGRSLGAFAYYSSTDRGAEFGSLFQLAYGFDEQGGFSENRVAHWQLRAGLHASEELSPVSGKNLLGATGPSPGFTGVDYPLAPRAFFVQMNLSL